MTSSPYRLLEVVVTTYDDFERPLTPADVASRFEVGPQRVDECFQQLVECELLARDEDGIRPTVTARELLRLDVDEEFLIVDAALDRCEPD